MMNRSELKALQAARSFPSVSIIAPTHRSFPASRQDPIRIRNLVAEAISKLKNQFPPRDIEPIVTGLEDLAGRIDFQHPQDGIALFVSRDRQVLEAIPFAVRERIVINETFATRDLVNSLNRTPRYWVLSLNERPTRLFHAVRDHLTEILSHGFPLAYENPLATDPKPAGNMVNKSGHRDEKLKNFFRHVDTALGRSTSLEPLPLVLTGVESNIAFFTEVSSHANSVLTTITGNHDQTPAHALAVLVWPAVEKALAARQEQVFKELDDAVGAHKVASGLTAAWRAAREGRGDLLLVEQDYHTAGRIDGSGLTLTPIDGDGIGDGVGDGASDGAGTHEDVVDELIEAVVLRNGRVVFTDTGSLARHDQVALILRY